MAWTGTEVILMADQLYRIEPAGGDWRSEAVDFFGPLVWADDVLIGSRYTELSTEPFDSDFLSHPVAWDPQTREPIDLPLPPESVYGPIWTGRYLLYDENRLALDFETRQWLRLGFDEPDGVAVERRAGAATVWAEDRQIVWGGWWGLSGILDRDTRRDMSSSPNGPSAVGWRRSRSGQSCANSIGYGRDDVRLLGLACQFQSAGEGLVEHRADVAQHPFVGTGIGSTLNVFAC